MKISCHVTRWRSDAGGGNKIQNDTNLNYEAYDEISTISKSLITNPHFVYGV